MCYLLAICFMKKNCFQRSVNYNYVNGSIFILNYDSWLIRMQVIFLLCLGEIKGCTQWSIKSHSGYLFLSIPVYSIMLLTCEWFLYSIQFWSQGRKAKSKIIKHILLSKLSVEEEKCLAEISGLCTEYVALVFFSNRIYSNCYAKFMTWFLSGSPCVFVSELLWTSIWCILAHSGVLSGRVAWEVAVVVTDCMGVSVGSAPVKNKNEL